MNKIQIEIEHALLESANVIVNGSKDVVKKLSDFCWELEVNKIKQQISIHFCPWGLDPLLRLNGFLLNKWLANVEQQDHCLNFSIDTDFIKQYRDNDLQGRLDSLGPDASDVTVDRVIGRSNNSDLVIALKEKIIEKSNLS